MSEPLLRRCSLLFAHLFFLYSLTESLEQTRGEKRKLDALVPSLQTQVRTLEAEKASLSQNLVAAQLETSRLAARPDESAKLAEVENELQDLKDQLQDAMDELDDAKAREAKTRGQLLEELSSVQSELSSTRTKLRQAERRNGAAK
jgi:chromosome segregation ATPase